jgi:hypothetical protein
MMRSGARGECLRRIYSTWNRQAEPGFFLAMFVVRGNAGKTSKPRKRGMISGYLD